MSRGAERALWLVGFALVIAAVAVAAWGQAVTECFCPKPPPAAPLILKDFCKGGTLVFDKPSNTISCVVP